MLTMPTIGPTVCDDEGPIPTENKSAELEHQRRFNVTPMQACPPKTLITA